MRNIIRLFAVLLTSIPLFAAAPFEYNPVYTNMTLMPVVGTGNRITSFTGGGTGTNDGLGGMFIWSTNGTIASVDGITVLDRRILSPVNETHTLGAGSLATATYYYRVSALTTNPLGETVPSTETSLAVTGPVGINVNWTQLPGATGYKIYGRATGAELLIAQVGKVGTYLDTGALTPAGAMPSTNSTMGVQGTYTRFNEYLFGSTGVIGTLTVTNSTTTGSLAVVTNATVGGTLVVTGTVTGSNISGSNTGDQTITLTGDVTGSGTGTFAATLANVIAAGGPIGSATTTPVITYDAKGRLTVVSSATISGVAPSGTAGGDLTNTYPNPLVRRIYGADVPIAGALTTGNVLQVNGVSSLTYGPVQLGGGVNYVQGTVQVENGGTEFVTATPNGVLYGNGTGAIQVTAQGAANTVLVANAGAPSFSAAITVGTSVTTPALIATTSLTTPAITVSGLTASRFVITDTGGLFATDSDFVYTSDTASFTKVLAPTSISSPSHISTAAIGLTPAAGNNFNVTTSGAGNFAVNATELVVDTGAGVGVGTATPSTLLHIVGVDGSGILTALRLQNNNGGTGVAALAFSSDATYSKAGIGQLREDANGAGPLIFYVDSNADAANFSSGDEKVRILTSGAVGIGTATPLAKFAVNGGLSVGDDVDPGDNNARILGTLLLAPMTPTSIPYIGTGGLIVQDNVHLQYLATPASIGLGGTADSAIGVAVTRVGAKTLTDYGLSVVDSVTSSTDAMTKVGLYVQSTGTWNGAGSVNYAVLINGASGGTANWALYNNSGAPVYLGTGDVSFGGTATYSTQTANTIATFNASKQLVSGTINPAALSPKYVAADPNFLGTVSDGDGQMAYNTSTGERWWYYAAGGYWTP